MRLSDAAFPAPLGLIATLGSLLIVGKDSFLLMAMALMLGCFFLRYHAVKGGVHA